MTANAKMNEIESRRSLAAFRIACVIGLILPSTGMAEEVDYLKQVKPLLRERCFSCHGALKQKGGLRLDTAKSILAGGDTGAVVTPGDAAASLLLERVTATDIAQRMPPEHEGEPLSPEQVGLLRAWITAGATGPDDEQPEADPREHWAFRSVVRPPVPDVQRSEWVRNPIDAFIAKQHEQHGLKPQSEAARLLLLRRLSLDLIGLPPTPGEVAAAQAAATEEWYEQTVTRLLEDPRHGERWARHWMDVWRYSDWWGLGDQLRNSQPHIWHWRDWIVESLNADTPYDEMLRLMLAADELHPNDLGKLRATGYLARNYFLFNRNQWMEETVEHVSKGFLGLTLNCAKCHDHKYDPFTHADFYRMRAFFEPYHARVDILPGEMNLARDGIPRVFDGLMDTPTYRFIRGQESNPDKSTLIAPGVPVVLEFKPLAIESVELPADAWQPERRAWVIDAYRTAATQQLTVAQTKLAAAQEKLAAKTAQPGAAEETANALAEARQELQVAELAKAVAQAELDCLEHRLTAMRATWARAEVRDAKPGEALTDAEKQAASAAARAEAEVAALQARLSLANLELRLLREPADKKDAINKQIATAREALDKAMKKVAEPGEQFTKIVGAKWTPTRFFNSSADDPQVTFQARSSGRRRALADWITDRRNPLTARVAVNQIWMRHMGTPLVPTVFDFGRKGTPPANPELLDWLAAELMDSGWSMKHLHRLIVQSATYRVSSSTAGADHNLAVDQDNQFLWRRTPMRLESQAVRDSILALAGTLDTTRGGPPVPQASQETSTRRSLYFFHSNNDRNLFLTMFDEALVKDCYRREQSIVPQQALALTNSKLVLDASRPIADRLTEALAKEAATDDAAFVRLAFANLLGAEPNAEELAASVQALENWRKLPEAQATDAGQSLPRANLIWVLLNHNDFLTVR